MDIHSGRYGGAVRNALRELCAILATLHDARGKVAVAGFDADAGALTPTQRADAQAFPFDAEVFLADVGAAEAGDNAYSLRKRITLRPALDLDGIWGGYTGPGSKTVIPRQAHAKMSMRIVPGQVPERVLDAVKRHLVERCPPGVRVRLGATVPITAVLKETMGVETLMFGYNLPDEPVHAPNEFFPIASIEKGLRAWPRMLRELATFEPGQFHEI